MLGMPLFQECFLSAKAFPYIGANVNNNPNSILCSEILRIYLGLIRAGT